MDANQVPQPTPTPGNLATQLLSAARALALSTPIQGLPQGRVDVIAGRDAYTITATLPVQRTLNADGETLKIVEFSAPSSPQ